jgi:multidrug transporter EmrE-like cation transporter
MEWGILFVAGLFEVGWAIGLKHGRLHPIMGYRLHHPGHDH